MVKLATPVQYESSLEGLNDLRPLQLRDEVKIVIPCPVLCKNPPSKNKPAVGMLARCSQQGALLTGNTKVCTAYEYIEQDFLFGNGDKLIQFSQKVSYVQSKVIVIGVWSAAWWTDPTYTEHYANLRTPYTVFIPFKGIDLYVQVICTVPAIPTTLGFWGFY